MAGLRLLPICPIQVQKQTCMIRTFLKSKIHRATVTEAELHYDGSVSIDEALLELADIHDHEQVDIYLSLIHI